MSCPKVLNFFVLFTIFVSKIFNFISLRVFKVLMDLFSLRIESTKFG